jgi:hypothetical protein
MEIERRHFYVTITSNGSPDLCDTNSVTDFMVHLPRPIDLGIAADWEVGLCEISYRPPKRKLISGVVATTMGDTNVLVYCNLIAPQLFNDQYVRVLRTIVYPSTVGDHCFQTVYYMPVEKRLIQDIHIMMRQLDGTSPIFVTDESGTRRRNKKQRVETKTYEGDDDPLKSTPVLANDPIKSTTVLGNKPNGEPSDIVNTSPVDDTSNISPGEAYTPYASVTSAETVPKPQPLDVLSSYSILADIRRHTSTPHLDTEATGEQIDGDTLSRGRRATSTIDDVPTKVVLHFRRRQV